LILALPDSATGHLVFKKVSRFCSTLGHLRSSE
jgi:hypothetical protein